MIGRSLGGFTIVRKLGSGGMGEVYLAEHRRIHRRVAVKILLPELSTDAELVARFLTEARAASLIKHPGILEVFDCDLVDDRVYLVMELLDGESLASALDRAGSLAGEARSVAALVGMVADALAAVHDKGIVHRDLKPENIFLTRGAPLGVKVLDFGVAKLAGDIAGFAPATQPGTILGTPVYMSPEQCRGSGAVDQRSDVYALGCITFEMLAGRPPFLGASPSDLLAAHVSQPAPLPSSMQPGVPPAFDALVARMLAKDPDARVGSMARLVGELEGLLGVPASAFLAQIPATTRLVPPRATTPGMAAATAPPPVTPVTTTVLPAEEVVAPEAEARAREEASTARWRAPRLPVEVAPLAVEAVPPAAERAPAEPVVEVPPDEPRVSAGHTRLIRDDAAFTTFRQVASERLVSEPPPEEDDDELPMAPARRSRRGWFVAGGTAAAVLIVGVVVLGSMGGAAPPKRRSAKHAAPVPVVEVAPPPAPRPPPPPVEPEPPPPVAEAAPEPEPATEQTPPRPKKKISSRPAKRKRSKFYLMGD